MEKGTTANPTKIAGDMKDSSTKGLTSGMTSSKAPTSKKEGPVDPTDYKNLTYDPKKIIGSGTFGVVYQV